MLSKIIIISAASIEWEINRKSANLHDLSQPEFPRVRTFSGPRNAGIFANNVNSRWKKKQKKNETEKNGKQRERTDKNEQTNKVAVRG